jgi:hypothetical protein
MALGPSKRQGILKWNRQKRNRYELDERQRIRNLALLVVRLSRRVPEENEARRAALDFLVREGIMPSVLRKDT